jgi:hypothetical protein
MSKQDLIEQAKAHGIKATTKWKVADLEEAISEAVEVHVLTAAEAAEHLGMTEDELMRSFHRGLAPGNLGFKEAADGPLVWKWDDLTEPSSEPDDEPNDEPDDEPNDEPNDKEEDE